MSTPLLRLLPLLALLLLQSCSSVETTGIATESASPIELLDQRFRIDFTAPLNADVGWASQQNERASLYFDQPFRFRIQVLAPTTSAAGHELALQYRNDSAHWKPIGVSDFPYPRLATPAVAIVSTNAYQHGDETERLLGTAETVWDDGFAINLAATTPVFRGSTEAMEWEWPLVVRRFADGPTFNDDGTVIEFRVVDGYGRPLSGSLPTSAEFNALPGHLGGTFIESPARIGPYQNDSGDLFFFMEPTETDNRFMAVKSDDDGLTWREVSGTNRPAVGDLEGVASARTGNTIHLLHQISEEVLYHAFRIGEGETWLVDSQRIATPAEPPTQFAALSARSDGSLVAMYAGDRRLFLQIRTATGHWEDPIEIDAEIAPDLSGPVVETLANDVVAIAYTAHDGRGFVRHLLADNSLTPRSLLSTNLGSAEIENGAILPIAALGPDAAIIYREQNGLLYERRLFASGNLSEPVLVSGVPVVTGAVDSDQVGADLISHNGSLHLLFINESTRSINYTTSSRAGDWSDPEVIISGIEGSWVRGAIVSNSEGQPVYGFVYDAGSQGGAGMNRFASIPLTVQP